MMTESSFIQMGRGGGVEPPQAPPPHLGSGTEVCVEEHCAYTFRLMEVGAPLVISLRSCRAEAVNTRCDIKYRLCFVRDIWHEIGDWIYTSAAGRPLGES